MISCEVLFLDSLKHEKGGVNRGAFKILCGVIQSDALQGLEQAQTAGITDRESGEYKPLL